jgi:tetratricopeptide (TPR) repeat protein
MTLGNSREPDTFCCEERFGAYLLTILALALLLRIAYTMVQPAYDPSFGRPAFDGAYYVEWASAIAQGDSTGEAAFYRAPLYAYLLAGLMRLGFGFALVYLLQHLLVLGAAAMLAVAFRPRIGAAGSLAAAALYSVYHPLLFFAGAPLGESLALFLLGIALLLVEREGREWLTPLAGFAAGLAALGRPNLLLVPVLWVGGELIARRPKRAALLLAGVAVAVLPVSVRNLVSSGHLVPISSNAGITLYHGNGPGARGVYTPPRVLSSDPVAQRHEALGVARVLSENPALDAVEADRWWGGQAVEARTADPVGTAKLLAKRALLLLDNHEHGLDYAPTLDANPLRPTWRLPWYSEIGIVPFGLLLGLSVAAVVCVGWSRSGGAYLWLALAAAAITPFVFYVSSRYRLPMAALLCVPAGAGLAGLTALTRRTLRPRGIAVAAGLLAAAVSFLVPSRDLIMEERAGGLANRAEAFRSMNQLELAEREARRGIAVNPGGAQAWFNLGVILEDVQRPAEAETAYRAAVERDPGMAEAASNLGRLMVQRGAPEEAVHMLRVALRQRPTHAVCRTNLIVALIELGRPGEAARELDAAEEASVTLDPELVRAVRELASSDAGGFQ